ncbi:MAG: LamG domain-containing protein, partial [Verrucomicrobiota bacterium]
MMRTKRERGLSLTTCLLLLALTIFVAPTSAQVLQYEFEEGTGLTTSDLTGNGHTGHLMGGAAFSFGKHPSSGGLLFDGSNDYVAISNLFYQGTNYATFSVSFWLKTTDKSNQVIASFDREEYWRVEINGPSAGQGDVGFTVATTSGAVESLGGTTRIDNGLWHHIVTVFDNGVLSLYIDGVLNNSKTVAGTTFGTGSTRYGFIGVGSEADVYDGSKSPTDYFNGSLDDFRIYNMGLTQTEVQALYDQKLADGLDADEDGLDDLWEYQYLLDLSQGPADDYDLDGLNNLN